MSKAYSFSNSKGLPKPTEKLDKQKGFIKWGEKNDYPFYLIDMYQGSAWHQGIIKSKTYYISGGGIDVVSGQMEAFLDNSFSDFSIQEVINRATFDYELFDAFAVLGTWNREGTKVAMWEHIDIDSIRMNEDESLYFISNDWDARKQDETTGYREILPFNPMIKDGKFIIYYKNPVKKLKGELGLYPKPSYVGGLTAINTDYLISKWHLHEIQNGFKGGTLVSLNNGQPESEEEARKVRDNIKGSSTDISDANQLIITFAEGKEREPTVLSLNGNDLADRYNLTEKSVQQNILVSHSAVNPLLFGIKTEGQLGGATELLESYEIFKSLYVNSRQVAIEFILNWMAELSGNIGQLKLKDAKPINTEQAAPQPTQEVEQAAFRSAEKDLKIFEGYGKKKDQFQIVKSKSVNKDFTSVEVEKFENDNYSGFFDKIGDLIIQLTDLDKSVLELLKRGEDGSAITKALNKPLQDVANSISKLTDLNLLVDGSTSAIGERLLERAEVTIDQFEVRYSYEVRPELGNEVIPTTRDFCRKLIEQDRLYLRTELDEISLRVDRDVWRNRGGFYHNPDTNRTTPWCRHEWRQHLVIKK